jgi:hypothetical protein
MTISGSAVAFRALDLSLGGIASFDIEEARRAPIEPIDDNDPLQRCAGRFGEKGSNQERGERRTNSRKHFPFLASMVGDHLQGKVPGDL